MPEILTESFCERCGTKYTFETGHQHRGRVARLGIFARGLRNYVLSDDPLDEALANARREEERSGHQQQLEAFHKTFNFCIDCRQYTCTNCWNEATGRCLSCAPLLEPAPLAGLFGFAASPSEAALSGNGPGVELEERPLVDAWAWPSVDLGASAGAPALEAEPQPPTEAQPPALTIEAEPPVELVTEAGPAAPSPIQPGLPEIAAAALAPPTEQAAPAPATDQTAPTPPEPPSETVVPVEAIEPVEPERAGVVITDGSPAAPPAPAERRFFVVPPGTEPSPGPAPAASPETRVPAAPLEQPAAAVPPGWQIVAPETPAWPPQPALTDQTPASEPAAAPAPWQMPAPAPSWPPAAAAHSGTDRWAPPPVTARVQEADVWVESSRDVLSRPGSGVRACVACGLPVSASARFCRRCGSEQG